MVKLCECGCGQPTKIITQTDRSKRRIKGEYARFIVGHNISKPVKMIKVVCEYCGSCKEIYPSALKQFRFCSKKCQGHYTRDITTKENGSSYINYYGYKIIKAKGHVMVDNCDWVLEHRKLMSDKLNRKLSPEEHVHHINGNRLDNRIENLMLMTASEHLRQHALENNFGRFGKEIIHNRDEKGRFV